MVLGSCFAAIESDNDCPGMLMCPELIEPYPLPGAHVQLSLGDGNGEATPDEPGFGMGRHIILALVAMLVKVLALGHQLIEDPIHILSHCWVIALV